MIKIELDDSGFAFIQIHLLYKIRTCPCLTGKSERKSSFSYKAHQTLTLYEGVGAARLVHACTYVQQNPNELNIK